MPSQLFRVFQVTRAPEADPIDQRQIKRMISVERPDSEWDVTEMRLTGPDEPTVAGQLVPVVHGEQHAADQPNAEGESRAASARTLHPLVGSLDGDK